MPITLAHFEPARLDWHAHAARAAHAAVAPPQPGPATGDSGFLALQAAYRGDGGIARGEDVAVLLSGCGGCGYVDLARSIVAGALFSFHWHETFWLPMFQFDPATMALREAPRRVLDELRGVFDGWDIAHWYVRANDALAGRRPIHLLETELPAVLTAARADRYAIDA